MEFDELVRQRLRDFIKGRSWSVSRFASRYVQAYSEAYSKMEAPSTSTARKLIEDNTHRLSEREAQVLDSFTGLNFHELWLEEQKQVLLSKTEQYVTEQNPKPSAFDSQTLLEGRIATLEKRPKAITLDDVIAVVRRYVDTATDKPLFIWSDSLQLLECATDSIADVSGDGTILRPVMNKIVDGKRFGMDYLISSATSHHGKVVYGIISGDWNLADDIRRHCADRVILFHVKGNSGMVGSLMELPYTSNLHPMYANMLRRCLEARPDFSPLFRREMECCIDSPWVKFPPFGDAGECMTFLSDLYEKQRTFIDDDALKPFFVKGFPDYWLTGECHQQSLLMAIKTFGQWREEHPDFLAEKVEDVKNIYLESLMLSGRVYARTPVQWKEWFTRCYYSHLVEVNLAKVIDITIATERRKKSLSK